MFKIIVLCFFIVSNISFAYVPPIETLLNNPSNPSFGKNTVAVSVVIGEMITDTLDRAAFNENKVEGLGFKFIANNSQPEAQYLTVMYQDKNLDGSKVVYSNLADTKLASLATNNDIDKSLLLATFAIIFNNDSSPVFKLCREVDCQFIHNKEIINQEKLDSLHKYKTTVMEQKDAVASEAGNRVSEKLSDDAFYKNNPNIKLDKMGSEFFWRFSDGKFDIKFDKNDHELRSISLTKDGKTSEVLIQKYSSINNEFMAPSLLLVKTSKNKTYKIKVEKMEVFPDSMDKMRDRNKKYSELKSRANLSVDHFLAQ